MVHVPAVRMVTVDEATEQTVPVIEAKLTAIPELAVAPTANDPAENEYEVTAGLNVMVCDAGVIVKFTDTGVAAL
jgi:hypothetical protein